MKKQVYKTKETEIPQTKITFRISKELKEQAEIRLRARGMTMTEYILKGLRKA